MKTTATLIGLLLVTTSFGQNAAKSSVAPTSSTPVRENVVTTDTSLPTAQIDRTTSGSNYIYQFESHRTVTDLHVTRWETRFPQQFTEIISISIDAQTQAVEIILPTSHSTSEFEKMVARFGYDGYQLTN